MSAADSTNQSDVLVRPASRKDLEAIGDLWVELMSFHARIDSRFGIPPQGRSSYIRHTYQAIRDNNYQVLVAEDQQQIVGYIIGYIAQNPPIFPQAQYGFIADICVTYAVRRSGVGEQMVKKICEWFRIRGMDAVQLNVAHHNPLSQAFWRKMGCTDYIDHMWLPLDADKL